MNKKRSFFVITIIFFAFFLHFSAAADSSWPPFHQAIEKQDFQKADAILSQTPDQAEIIIPIKAEVISRVGFLLEKAKNFISATDDVQIYPTLIGYTTLELAIIYGAPIDLIEKLIALGQDVNLKRFVITVDKIGVGHSEALMEVRTPLLEAIKSDNLEIIQLLINHGADLNFVIWHGSYFRHVFNGAAFNGYWLSFEQIVPSSGS